MDKSVNNPAFQTCQQDLTDPQTIGQHPVIRTVSEVAGGRQAVSRPDFRAGLERSPTQPEIQTARIYQV